MKKLLLLTMMLLVLVLVAAPAFAGTKTLTFAWNQEIGEGFAGWKLYRSTNPGVPVDSAALFAEIPYGGAVQTEYQASQPLTSPDGEAVTYYFVLTAFDTAGNESGASNEVSVEIDFQAPTAPYSLTVTVKATP